ncbi:MAG: MazG nucleotide pyrophosphohydrolase domain-containing protein [Thermoleophilaceae bacterium]
MADPTEALVRLDAITRQLRVECPWDREQDERSIVPHTVEEAYELADAARSGDDAKMVDELGDVLFQVQFLALLLEERGAGSLAQVADQLVEKLIRRHPHVFGDVDAETEEKVKRNWDAIKADTEGGGLFGDLPDTLPATLYAKKAQRRGTRAPTAPPSVPDVTSAARALAAGGVGEASDEAAGDLLFAAVQAATAAGADPELALRSAADRYIERVQEIQTDP